MKVLAGACLILFAAAAQAQTPAQFDRHARELSTRTPLVHRSVHPLRNGTEWARYEVALSNIKWDVRKTDSLLTPVVAIVAADLVFTSTQPQPSRDSAETADVRPPKDVDRIELTFAPTESGWQWISGRTALATLKGWNPITPGEDNLPKDPQMRWLAEQFLPHPK